MSSLFPNGPLEEAALTVLACTNLGQTSSSTRYRVKYDCCGREGLLLHRGLRRRIQRGVRLCRACCQRGEGVLWDGADQTGAQMAELAEQMLIDEEEALRRSSRRAYDFTVPPWPVPKMTVSMYVRERDYYTNQC